MGELDEGLPNEKDFIAEAYMFNLFSCINFVTRLEINKIVSTRQINSNTHQYASTLLMLVYTLLYV